MPWFKVDDAFYRHPKVRRLGKDRLPAIGLWQLAGTWCADNVITNVADGFVPDSQIELWDARHRYGKRLVEVGLWERIEIIGEPGYLFHDWSDFNPTKVEVAQRRIEDWMRKDLYARPGLVSAIKERDGDICRYCGVTVKWSDRRGQQGGTIDHLLPVSRGGQNDRDNLVVACRRCNSIKGAKTPAEASMVLLAPKARTRTGTSSKLVTGQNGSSQDLPTVPVPGPVPLDSSVGGVSHEPARASAPPPRCPKHLNDADPPPCRACRDARQAAEAWTADQSAAELKRRRDCVWCNADGDRLVRGSRAMPVTPYVRCDHTRDQLDRPEAS